MASHTYNFIDVTITGTDDNGNSATVVGYLHDLAITGLIEGGQVMEFYESQGSYTGARKAGRQPVQVSLGKQVRGAIDTWTKLVLGQTTGFTSTTADIGDGASIDLDISWLSGGVEHDFQLDDCFSGVDTTDGSPLSDAFAFTCIGPVVRDGETVISSR